MFAARTPAVRARASENDSRVRRIVPRPPLVWRGAEGTGDPMISTAEGAVPDSMRLKCDGEPRTASHHLHARGSFTLKTSKIRCSRSRRGHGPKS